MRCPARTRWRRCRPDNPKMQEEKFINVSRMSKGAGSRGDANTEARCEVHGFIKAGLPWVQALREMMGPAGQAIRAPRHAA